MELEQRSARERDALVCGSEDDIGFWDGGVVGQEGDDGVRVGSCDGGEEGRGVERAGVEEVGGFCPEGGLAGGITRGRGAWRRGEGRTATRFEGVGAECQHVGREAGLEEGGFVSGDGGG